MALRLGVPMYLATGVAVQILCVDVDPSALVWVFEIENPDVDHMVRRDDLFVTAEDANVAWHERQAERRAEGR